MSAWSFGICLLLTLAGIPIGVRHAIFVMKGKYGTIEYSSWSKEGFTCALFCIATIVYICTADHPQLLAAIPILLFTFVYMVAATVLVTSTSRCPNACMRTCNCDIERRPHPKTGWLLLAILAMRHLVLLALLIGSIV
jgi:hypothetical protein